MFYYQGKRFCNEKEAIIQEVATDPDVQMSPEDRASDILRNYYGNLSQSLHHTTSVAQLLCEEKVISDITLFNMKDIRRTKSERKTILLKSIRGAVHVSYYNLRTFASVLLKFNENVQFGDAILRDYSKI